MQAVPGEVFWPQQGNSTVLVWLAEVNSISTQETGLQPTLPLMARLMCRPTPEQHRCTAPDQPPDQPPEQPSSVAASPAALGDAACVCFASTGLDCRPLLDLPAAAGASSSIDLSKPYLGAACSEVITINMANMIKFKAGFCGAGNKVQPVTAHLDNGCSLSGISEALLKEKWPHLFPPGGRAELLELRRRIAVGMLAGQNGSLSQHVVRGLALDIGKGTCPADLLVVKTANFALVLGQDFLYTYAGTPLVQGVPAVWACPDPAADSRSVPAWPAAAAPPCQSWAPLVPLSACACELCGGV